MNKKEQRKLSKKLYDELHEEGLVKKQGNLGLLIWMIAFGTACDHIRKRNWLDTVVLIVGWVALTVFLLVVLFGGDVNVKIN